MEHILATVIIGALLVYELCYLLLGLMRLFWLEGFRKIKNFRRVWEADNWVVAVYNTKTKQVEVSSSLPRDKARAVGKTINRIIEDENDLADTTEANLNETIRILNP